MERDAQTTPRRAPSVAETARQFGEHARQYAVSPVHREGRTRLLLLEWMEPVADETMLDVGCGPGAVALTFAPYVRAAAGLDLAPEMLRAAHLGARQADVGNLRLVAGDVHRLPFAERSFDLVASRATPHHFADVAVGLAEMTRVLRRGGRLGIADGTVPEDDELDHFINQLDLLHDPTTVRNYRPSEWRALVTGTGLRVDRVEEEAYDTADGRSLVDWMARSGASSAVVAEARRRLLEAPPRVRDYLRVRPSAEDVIFDLPKVVLVAKRVD